MTMWTDQMLPKKIFHGYQPTTMRAAGFLLIFNGFDPLNQKGNGSMIPCV